MPKSGLDALDRKILEALQADGRMTLADLSCAGCEVWSGPV
jgi:DNA-binding Lrp family transcriptional regulator